MKKCCRNCVFFDTEVVKDAPISMCIHIKRMNILSNDVDETIGCGDDYMEFNPRLNQIAFDKAVYERAILYGISDMLPDGPEVFGKFFFHPPGTNWSGHGIHPIVHVWFNGNDRDGRIGSLVCEGSSGNWNKGVGTKNISFKTNLDIVRQMQEVYDANSHEKFYDLYYASCCFYAKRLWDRFGAE